MTIQCLQFSATFSRLRSYFWCIKVVKFDNLWHKIWVIYFVLSMAQHFNFDDADNIGHQFYIGFSFEFLSTYLFLVLKDLAPCRWYLCGSYFVLYWAYIDISTVLFYRYMYFTYDKKTSISDLLTGCWSQITEKM